jgi:hypothetical protein
MTYDPVHRHYFQGVDPGKLGETGDLVLLCGGYENRLRDLLLIPWEGFFSALSNAEPIRSYRDHPYRQYKFVVRNRDASWFLAFHRGQRPRFPLDGLRYDVQGALAAIRKM